MSSVSEAAKCEAELPQPAVLEGRDSFADLVASLAIAKLRSLLSPPLNAKLKSELSILAAIFVANSDSLLPPVCVALGTGSKCLPTNKHSKIGDALLDSHAETICRRAFVQYLLDEIHFAQQNKSEIITIKDSKFIINSNISFHMYISQPPCLCGDASMAALSDSQTPTQRINNESKKRKHKMIQESTADPSAKCLKSGPVRGRLEYNLKNVVRTKPGRMDSNPSHSKSCSDKLSKYNVVGLAGALAAHFIAGVYLKTLIIGGPSHFETQHAVVGRSSSVDLTGVDGFSQGGMVVRNTAVVYEGSALSGRNDRLQMDISMNWWIGVKKLEVTVQGRRQGAAMRKGVWRESARSRLCKLNVFKRFAEIVKACPSEFLPESLK
ncbi:hypothetical protein HK096_007976 [Nowakowskiella sp. JEL0078]|nr:hypothetical protein HK096_007976 [Nowakowskiella sp. JEL0078]